MGPLPVKLKKSHIGKSTRGHEPVLFPFLTFPGAGVTHLDTPFFLKIKRASATRNTQTSMCVLESVGIVKPKRYREQFSSLGSRSLNANRHTRLSRLCCLKAPTPHCVSRFLCGNEPAQRFNTATLMAPGDKDVVVSLLL